MKQNFFLLTLSLILISLIACNSINNSSNLSDTTSALLETNQNDTNSQFQTGIDKTETTKAYILNELTKYSKKYKLYNSNFYDFKFKFNSDSLVIESKSTFDKNGDAYQRIIESIAMKDIKAIAYDSSNGEGNFYLTIEAKDNLVSTKTDFINQPEVKNSDFKLHKFISIGWDINANRDINKKLQSAFESFK